MFILPLYKLSVVSHHLEFTVLWTQNWTESPRTPIIVPGLTVQIPPVPPKRSMLTMLLDSRRERHRVFNSYSKVPV